MTRPVTPTDTATHRYYYRHSQAVELLDLLAPIRKRTPATANWADVADIAEIVKALAEAAAYAGVITDADADAYTE